MENIVMNHLKNNTKVRTCPECNAEFFDSVEINFINEYGVCVECDKKLSDQF